MKVDQLDLCSGYSTIEKEIESAVLKFMKDQKFILGEEVEKLEQEIAEYCDVKYGVGVASGTDALYLSLDAMDIKEGQEVITTPFTFFATASSIYRTGAKSVFVDIDTKTFNINPDLIESSVNEKTRAILVVHLYGQCSDMDKINHIANKYNLKVLEDSAQSIGALYKNKKACSMSDAGCLSFFPTKNLGGFGDGGMVLTNNADFADKVRMLRVHGSKQRYVHEYVGYNSRLDAIQALVLRIKLKFLDEWNEKRRLVAKRYNDMLSSIQNIRIPAESLDCQSVYNQYTIKAELRDQLRDFLGNSGIGTSVHYPICLHLQKCFSNLGYKKGDFPNAEKSSAEVLSLPMYPELTVDQQAFVVDKIIQFYNTKG